VVAISAVVLLVTLFALDWFSAGSGAAQVSANGWTSLTGARWLLLITIVAALGLFFCQATRRSPAWPVTLSVLVAILGGLSTIWLLIRVPIDPPAGRDFGGWLALVSAAVLTWGAYRSMGLEGIAPEDGPGEIRVLSADELEGGQDPALDEHS
jgi:hypothetical protein